jgi:hypothetical protein
MKKILLVLLLAIWWHLLIWQAQMGLNTLLFSVSISAAIAWIKPQAFARMEVKYLLAAWCIAGFWVFWHNSLLSMVVYWLFGFITLGYLQEIRVRFWVFGIVESIRALFGGWWISIRHTGEQLGDQYTFLPSWRKVRLLLLPALIVIPFYLIYSEANTALGAFNDTLLKWADTLFQLELDWSRVVVFLLGWALVAAFLGQRTGITPLHQWVANWDYPLHRKRQRLWPAKTMALKQEYQSALLTFTALNILLGIINSLDIVFVWLSRQERTASELSAYVHEGTWLLIFSIVLAMLVVLGFFRANLNFFANNQRLRQLAYVWLGQNAFLALSVGVRNGYYIHHYALAHGRIVVVFFLALVLFGLFTMYLKVKGPKTIYFLLQTNAAAVMVALLLAASVNWDRLITRYNLSQEDPDLYHLVEGLDNNLTPLLQAAEGNTMLADQLRSYALRERGTRLARKQQNTDWRGWNWSEYRQYQAWLAYQKTIQ